MDAASTLTSPAEHPNVTHYKRMIRAFNENDLETVSRLLDPSVVYTIPGRSPLAGTTTGIPGLIAALGATRERSGNTLRLDLTAVVGTDDYVFVYGHVTATRLGRTLDSDHCVVFRFVDGKVVEGRTLPVDLYEFDAFWA